MSPIGRLSCEELFRRLDDYVDRELDEREAQLVREHLETCAVCAAEYAFEASVLNHVRARLARIRVPSGLMARIAKRLAEAEGKRD